MNIVVDLDGVIFNSESFVRTEAELYDQLHLKGKGLKNERKFTTYKRYGWSKEETEKFENSIYPEVGYYCTVLPGAKRVLELLKSEGHNLFVVTKRGYFGQSEIELTNKKLQEEGLNFDRIIYNQSNKVDACKRLNAEIVLEDNFEHIEDLIKENIKCIYLRDICEPEVVSPLVYEVHNWGEIYKTIRMVEEQEQCC